MNGYFVTIPSSNVSSSGLSLSIFSQALIRLFPIHCAECSSSVANWQVQSERQMKRGDTDLSEVVTALLSFHFSPLSALLSLLFSATSSLCSLHLPALLLFSYFFLSTLSSNLPFISHSFLVFCPPFPSPLVSFFPSVGNELPVIPIYFDDLFSSLSGENYSVHTCSHTHALPPLCVLIQYVSIFTATHR